MRYYEKRNAALGKLQCALSNYVHQRTDSNHLRGAIAAATRAGITRRQVVQELAHLGETFTHARTFTWEN